MNLVPMIFFLSIFLMLITGFYCLFVIRNLIRVVIALEVLTKAVTLLLIYVGFLTRQLALAQAFVITLIVIEVVVIAVAAGIVIGVFRHNETLDIRKLRNLKG